MSDWEPIFEEEVLALISDGWYSMNTEQRQCWEAIKIIPEKWLGDDDMGEDTAFWVVAVTATRVVWYNHITEGFALSRYVAKGQIPAYESHQDDLEIAVQHVINRGDFSR